MGLQKIGEHCTWLSLAVLWTVNKAAVCKRDRRTSHKAVLAPYYYYQWGSLRLNPQDQIFTSYPVDRRNILFIVHPLQLYICAEYLELCITKLELKQV